MGNRTPEQIENYRALMALSQEISPDSIYSAGRRVDSDWAGRKGRVVELVVQDLTDAGWTPEMVLRAES